MLKINFEAETEKDVVSPINVASALIANGLITTEDLEDISSHLDVYTRRCRTNKNHRRRAYNDDEF